MKKLLIVVDMQNDFVDGALGTKEAQALVPKLADYIRNYDGVVIATRDTHNSNYLETLEGKNLPVVHCVKETNGWQINPEINNALIARGDSFVCCINKPTFGSFELIDKVADYITSKDGIIELCGVCTGICVLSNAIMLRAAYPDMRIVVNANYTECVTPEAKNTALNAMKLCQIEVVE